MCLQTVKFLWRAQCAQYVDLRRETYLLSFGGEELSKQAREENFESNRLSGALPLMTTVLIL